MNARCPDCSATGERLTHDKTCPLGLAIDAFCDLGRLWFEQHPGEVRYVRPITWAEQQESLLYGVASILLTTHVVVTQLAPGVRHRHPIAGEVA